jgi:hypothetical protein
MTLFLVSYSMSKTHLSIFLANASALENTALFGSSVVSMLLRHAYTTQPYNSTLVTSAFIIYIFIRTLDKPRVLQLVFTAWYILFAFTNLAYKIPSGFILAFDSSIPRYLNLSTVSI